MIWVELIFVLVWTAAFAIGWLVYRQAGHGSVALRAAGAGCNAPLASKPATLSSLDTPCEIEAYLLVEVAHAGGPMSSARRAALEAQLRDGVSCCDAHVGRLVDRMLAVTGCTGGPRKIANFERVSRHVKRSVDKRELLRLREMMNNVAYACRGPTVNQLDLIARYERITRI